MTSYNRIGSVASSANKAVMVDIMRNEWGFKGYNVTDFTGVSPKAAPKESILAGTCAFCGFGKPSLDYWNAETLGKIVIWLWLSSKCSLHLVCIS